MNFIKTRLKLISRISLATIALYGILMLFAHDVMPQVSQLRLISTSLLGTAAALCIISLIVLAKTAINRFVLHHGGIDTGWLWFSQNPHSLEKDHH